MRTRNNLFRHVTALLLALALCLPLPLGVRAEEAKGTAWVYLEDAGRLVKPEEGSITGEFSLGLPQGMILGDHLLWMFHVLEFTYDSAAQVYEHQWVRGTETIGWAYEFFEKEYPYYLEPELLAQASYANQREIWNALAQFLLAQAQLLSPGSISNGAFSDAPAWYYRQTIGQDQTQAVFTNVPVGQYLCLTNDSGSTGGIQNMPLTVTVLPQREADGLWYLRNVQVSLKGSTVGLSRTVDRDQVGTGDTVTFSLDIRVPRYQPSLDADGSETEDTAKRDFSLTEVLAPGFTLLEDTIHMEQELPPGAFTRSTVRKSDGSTEITWEFSYGHLDAVSELRLTYQARINEAMSVGTDSNTAAATLTYVKDTSGELAAITDSVRLWTYGVTIVKADGVTLEEVPDAQGTRLAAGEESVYLSGAVFQLSRQIGVYVASSPEELRSNLAYWTAVRENQERGQLYTLPIYKPDGVTVEGYGLYLSMENLLTTDTPQGVSLGGLAPGTYLLVETLAPEGYNRLSNGIRFTIPETVLPDGAYYGKRDSLKTFTDAYGTESASGHYELLIANYRGVQLPDTGGVGIFGNLHGGLLLIAAAMFVFLRGYPLKINKKEL